MQKALENIKKKLSTKHIKTKGDNALRLEEGVQDFELNTSHYYVKLIPQNAEQEAILKEDPNIHVFDYPLDYEFTDEYLDNRTPDNDSIPEYYTSIILGQELPSGVPHEILEDLYIPEEDPFFDDLSFAKTSSSETRQGEIGNNEDLLRHLLMEAYTLTDNKSELIGDGDTSDTRWIFGNKWNPSGTLKIWDDIGGNVTSTTKVFSHWEYYDCSTGDPTSPPSEPLPYELRTENARIDPIDDNTCQRAVYTYNSSTTKVNYLPLEGAQVLMRQWFTIRQGITDANGNFSTGSVRGNTRYIIQWERHNYSIRSGWFGQAETRGPKKNDEAWIYNIKDGKAEYYGTIHKAAHNYYYKNIDGLNRPPEKSFFRKQIKIAVYLTNEGKNYNLHYIQILPYQPWPTITIKRYEDESSAIFGTVTHELAHSTHARHAGLINFAGAEKRLRETYAQTIEWYLTTKYYKQNDIDYVFEYNYQYRTPTANPTYTSLMVDLIDDFNQQIENGNTIYPYDRVKNYSIQQIENEVMKNKTFLQLKNDLKDNYYNSTANYLDELFNHWN